MVRKKAVIKDMLEEAVTKLTRKRVTKKKASVTLRATNESLIRRFVAVNPLDQPVGYGSYGPFELRLLPPHHRTLLLGNGRHVSVPFPWSLCFCSAGRVFTGMAFTLQELDLNKPFPTIYPVPIPNMQNFTPTCHPGSEVGRDWFEHDFNGYFGSPFQNDYFYNKQLLQEAFGSFREWAKLTHEEVAERLKRIPMRPNNGAATLENIFSGYFPLMQQAGCKPFRLKEIDPLPSRLSEK